MNLQYLADKEGHTTVAQIQMPLDEWDLLKTKYKEFEIEEDSSLNDVPDWQIALGRSEVENVRSGNTELIDWETVKKKYK